MSVVNENWQTKRRTVRERTKFMLNNDLFSDVKFAVRKSDDETESKQVIPAHKFVLSIGSPVFEAMFYGGLAETNDTIELPDCEYKSLLELFRFMYSDEVRLSGSNVMGVLYLAKKYMVPSLAEKCTEYVQHHLHASNVFSILPPAQKYEEKKLVDRCWEVIDEQTEAAVNSDAFVTIERSLLEEVVERETLDIAEVELFKGVNKWATKKAEKKGTVADGQEKRRIIGERIINAIRFPVMRLEEFASVVLDSQILTCDEVTGINKCMGSVSPVTKRSGPLRRRCCRFGSVDFGWRTHGSPTGLSFTVDRDIMFHGVYLYGGKGYFYSATLSIVDESTRNCIAKTEASFCSVPHPSATHQGFDVLLKKPIFISKGTLYSVESVIYGYESWYGINGLDAVECTGVTFNFKPHRRHVGTNRQGQCGELIFSVCK